MACEGPPLHLNSSALLSSLIFGWKLWVPGQWVISTSIHCIVSRHFQFTVTNWPQLMEYLFWIAEAERIVTVQTWGLGAGTSKCTSPLIRGPACCLSSFLGGSVCVDAFVLACVSLCRTGVGNPKAIPDVAGAPRQRDRWRQQMIAGWMSFVLPGFWPVLFRGRSFEQGQLWWSGDATAGCSRGCATAASFWSLQRDSEGVWVKKPN